MTINGKPIEECSDAEVKQAFDALVADIGAQQLAEVEMLKHELERRFAKARENAERGW